MYHADNDLNYEDDIQTPLHNDILKNEKKLGFQKNPMNARPVTLVCRTLENSRTPFEELYT